MTTRRHFRIGRSIKHKPLRRFVRIVAGVVLLAVGVLGLILPFVPGWPFLASGVVLLWPRSRLGRWLVRALGRIRDWRLRRRMPVEARDGVDVVGERAAVIPPLLSAPESKG